MGVETQDLITAIQPLITAGNPTKIAAFFKEHHPADIADALEELSDEDKNRFFSIVKPALSGNVLEEMSMTDQITLISDLKLDQAARVVDEMEPDDAVDLLEELYQEDAQKATDIIDSLPDQEADELITLLSYPEDSAGAIMTSNYCSIPEDLSVAEALSDIKSQSLPDTTSSFFIFIIDTNHQLKGYTTLRRLLLAKSDEKVRSIRTDYPVIAHTLHDQEDVAKDFQKYNLVVIPVIDDRQKLVGIITVDDVVDVVIEEATEDIYKLSGTADITEEKLLSGSLTRAIKSRLPWLLLTIIGGLVASWLITTYSMRYTFTQFPLALSLSFVPLLMGLGGNVGNQSATIFVRGLSTGIIKPKDSLKLIARELIVGLLIGLILGISLFALCLNLGYSQSFCIIVSLALGANIATASFIGASLPLIFNKLDIDPAVASAPFISMTLDIVSQIIYFALTFWILTAWL